MSRRWADQNPKVIGAPFNHTRLDEGDERQHELPGRAQCITDLGDGDAFGPVCEQAGHDPGRFVDGARREEHAVVRHDVASPHQGAHLASVVAVGRRWGERFGFERRDEGMVGQRVGRAAGASAAFDHLDAVEGRQNRSFPSVEGGGVETEPAGVGDGAANAGFGLGEGGGAEDP